MNSAFLNKTVDEILDLLLKIDDMSVAQYRQIERTKHLPRDKWTLHEIRVITTAVNRWLEEPARKAALEAERLDITNRGGA